MCVCVCVCVCVCALAVQVQQGGVSGLHGGSARVYIMVSHSEGAVAAAPCMFLKDLQWKNFKNPGEMS